MHAAWRYFATWLHLDAPLAQAWWEALCTSRSEAATVIRQNVTMAATLSLNQEVLLLETLRPAVLVHLVEALVEQALLTRTQGSQIEECILAVTTPAPTGTPPATLERAIFGKVTPAQQWALRQR
jgi:hypothetical protein